METISEQQFSIRATDSQSESRLGFDWAIQAHSGSWFEPLHPVYVAFKVVLWLLSC